MRTHIGLVVGIVGVCFLAGTATAQVYTEPVGFVKVDTYRSGLTMISVPLNAADKNLYGAAGCIGDMIAEPLTGGAGATTADLIWKWDEGPQTYQTAFLIDGWGEGYDGKWWDEGTGDFSTMQFSAGDAAWIQRRTTGDAVGVITFLGWVPVEASKTVTMVKGLTMFAHPFPISVALNDSGLGAVGTGGAGATTADMVWEWKGDTQSYTTAFLIAGWGAPYDGQWWDETTGDYTTIGMEPGRAFWYLRRPDAAASWVVSKPY